MMHGLKTQKTVNPIDRSTIATNTSPIKNHHFPLTFLHLLDEVVLGLELKSSALLRAEAWMFTPTLAGGSSSTPTTQTIISSNGVTVISVTPMLGAVGAAGAVGASTTPMMEVARELELW